MNIKSVEWIILVTDRYSKSRNFYSEMLGLEIVREALDEEFSQFRLANCFLAIYGRKEIENLIGKQNSMNSGGAIHAFGESVDIDQDVRNMKKKGVRFIKEPITQPWGQRSAYFTDPDGHIWELQ